jgi:hypothetical protein
VNYYLLAQDVEWLSVLRWHAVTSMPKTLAAKHKSTVTKMAARHQAKVITGEGPRTCFEARLNLSRPWHKGNHPGLIFARRLKRKAAQVWLFTTRFDVPATNNGSENAVRGYTAASPPRKSAAAGAPWPPSSATAASAPGRRPQPRPPPPHRHPRRPQPNLLDAITPSMIN